jgi:purine-binding chemotaxis protein CheW
VNGHPLSLGLRAAALRDAFDRSFAVPLPPDPPPGRDLLAIRVGEEPYALYLSDIAALHPDRRTTPLPGSMPALRGIAGFRGAVVPVYDLAALLGQPPAEVVRWHAIAASAPVAFAFAWLDRQLRVPREAIVRDETGERPHRHVREFARTEGVVHPIVDLPSVVDAVKRLIEG